MRNAPKLAPLVSAIGVSFSFMNIGQLWGGSADRDFPDLIERKNLLAGLPLPLHLNQLQFTLKDLLLLVVVVPTMIGLTLLVKRTQLGRAMRATAQDPVAARLMGIPVERVIGATFLIGGGLAGIASVIYGLYINTIQFQMGYQDGAVCLYGRGARRHRQYSRGRAGRTGDRLGPFARHRLRQPALGRCADFRHPDRDSCVPPHRICSASGRGKKYDRTEVGNKRSRAGKPAAHRCEFGGAFAPAGMGSIRARSDRIGRICIAAAVDGEGRSRRRASPIFSSSQSWRWG